jgi:endonuclease/exonuclease/phosphatase family metal-dependent hydrolase
VLFAKCPVTFERYEPLPPTRFADRLVQKGNLHVRVGSFRLIAVHFPESHAEMSAFIGTLPNTPEPVIILGDFNVTLSQEQQKAIGTNCFEHTQPVSFFGAVYDYMFLRNACCRDAQVVDMTNASDHPCLVATFCTSASNMVTNQHTK